ncbi:hypothetical protein ACH4VM_38730 [Streptomyces sp. NPDC020792]|uniref:hypothetical protein n=1 Tax=Streptomyces sp. NPDC020792 TaxID=3365089 RepID=UPI0037A2CDE1
MASHAVFTHSSRLGRAPSGSIFGCRRVGRPVGASGLAVIDVSACPRKARLRSAFVGRRSTAQVGHADGAEFDQPPGARRIQGAAARDWHRAVAATIGAGDLTAANARGKASGCTPAAVRLILECAHAAGLA